MTNMENGAKKHERWAFETFGEKRYSLAIGDVCARLCEFSDAEAIAILEAAKASIGLRRVFFRGDNPVKHYGCEKVLGEVSNSGIHQT